MNSPEIATRTTKMNALKMTLPPEKSVHPSVLIIPFYTSMLISADSQLSRWLFNFFALFIAYTLWDKRKELPEKLNSSALLGVALILYTMATLFWGEGDSFSSYIRWGTGLLFFWLGLILISCSPKEKLKETALHLCIATLAVCIYTILNYFFSSDAPSRNMGPGIIQHPIMGPSILIAVSASAVMMLQALGKFPTKLAAVLFSCLLIYTLTTASRGPLLALGAWGAALCLTSPVSPKTKWLAVLATCLSLIILYAVIPDFFHSLIARGSTHRIDIWAATVKTLEDTLFFGRGINLKFVDTELSQSLVPVTELHIQHPHNLGLSTWVYSGLTGVILLFATTISAPLIMAKKNMSYLIAAIPAITAALFLSLTDLSKLIAPPSAIWFVFWLPFGFIAGLSHRNDPKEHH